MLRIFDVFFHPNTATPVSLSDEAEICWGTGALGHWGRLQPVIYRVALPDPGYALEGYLVGKGNRTLVHPTAFPAWRSISVSGGRTLDQRVNDKR